MKTLFLMLIPFICFAQMRPLPALCMADEPDIHSRIPETVYKSDAVLLEKIDFLHVKVMNYASKQIELEIELNDIKEQRRLEKKIAGITGLLLFASGNENLKNLGLVSLFCYSIW